MKRTDMENKEKKRFDYRHIICAAITLGFMACAVFVFPAALGRVIEGGRDLGLSVAFYFMELFDIEHGIVPTVNDLPQMPFFEHYGGNTVLPSVFIAENWEQFKADFAVYWQLWASADNFKGYLSSLASGLYIVCIVILLVVPLIAVAIILFKRYLKKENNDYDKDSRPLKAAKKIAKYTYLPVKAWIIGFFGFVREHKPYWAAWLCIWAYNFNLITIVLEFFAFYFYFVVSFDFINLYRQVYKLFLDLYVPFTFIPLWVWAIIGIVLFDRFRKSIAYARLNHYERRNRGFINARPIVFMVCGTMGKKKTTAITDMALSQEVMFRDKAFEKILENDLKFPFFPWINLENELRRVMEYHVVYNLATVRAFIAKKAVRWQKNPCRERLFGYDYERYGFTYDDKLKTVDVWEVIETYAQLYFIYIIQSSLLIANYSVRVDGLLADIGNFPMWNTDFFRRDSRLIDSFSRHSHILDFDMLRLGKKMLEDNPNRNAFGFGVYTISEIDKERKNAPELQGTEKKAAECNQKNDLFNACLKISRHSCVIANRVFLKVLSDLQRTGSLNSDMLELGDEIEVQGKTEMLPVLPFYSPFWVVDLLFGKIADKFYDFYLKYRFNRSDTTLFLYIVKTIVSKTVQYRERINNVFGCQTLKLKVARGLDNGESKEYKWYRQSKKIFSKRYSTDCLSGIFESRGNLNAVGIDDLKEYADIMATNDELLEQHSHFQNEINALYQG